MCVCVGCVFLGEHTTKKNVTNVNKLDFLTETFVRSLLSRNLHLPIYINAGWANSGYGPRTLSSAPTIADLPSGVP